MYRYEIFGLLFVPSLLLAQITTDGTMGAAQTLTGPNYTIPEALGTRLESNLFHSFDAFNLNATESATFTGADNISNVISRVTGNMASIINGQLTSTIGQANFYFINPNGVVFNESAKVDVPAGFYVSTAAELQFSDGGKFSAIQPENSQLTSAAPVDFGFLASQTGTLTMTGSRLEFKPDQAVNLSANKISIDNTAIIAENNVLQIAATELDINQSTLDTSGQADGGISLQGADIVISNSIISADNVSDSDATRGIAITANNLLVGNSLLSTDAFADGHGGTISVVASESMQLFNDATLLSNAFSSGEAGDVIVNAKTILIDGQGIESGLASLVRADATGDAGLVSVVTERLALLNGGQILSITLGDGDAGVVEIQVNDLLIDAGDSGKVTGISSQTNGQSGDAGVVNIVANGLIQVNRGGQIDSVTFGDGGAGDVNIQAVDLILDGQGHDATIASSSLEGASGDAGNVTLDIADSLVIVDGGNINSIASGEGEASIVNISAGRLTIDGKGNEETTGISSQTKSTADAGVVNIKVDGLLAIFNEGQIDSSTLADGDAGIVNINAGNLLINGEGMATGITSGSLGEGQGNAGDINLNVSQLLSMVNGGIISSNTTGSGAAGLVAVKAGQLLIDGHGENETSITSRTTSSGSAGIVDIEVNDLLHLTNGGIIDSTTLGSGPAGSVVIVANDLLIDGQGVVTAISSGSLTAENADAGDIQIAVAEQLIITDGGVISNNTLGLGNGGDINIAIGDFLGIDGASDAGVGTGIVSKSLSLGNAGDINVLAHHIEIINGGEIGNDTLGAGNAGFTSITANQLILSHGGQISSSSEQLATGDAGGILLKITELLQIQQDGTIKTNSDTAGQVGIISIETAQLLIDGQAQEQTTGISNVSNVEQSSGVDVEGGILIVADDVRVINDGEINNSTFGVDNAGVISIKAGQLTVNEGSKVTGSSKEDATGNAGSILLEVAGLLQIQSGGSVKTDTDGIGDSGKILIETGQLMLDGQGVSTEITSVTSGAGTDGGILITAQQLDIRNAGEISSRTEGSGNAGVVTIEADNVVIDGRGAEFLTGITSTSEGGGQGNAGIVVVTADNVSIKNQGEISVSSFAVIPEGINNEDALAGIILETGHLSLNNAEITSESRGNTVAGVVGISTQQLRMQDAIISTQAALDDGGKIQIAGHDLVLRDSQITTSVQAADGDGGDIDITAKIMVLDTGFIQANAASGDGGQILIDLPFLLAEGGALAIADNERLQFQADSGFSVIQAATNNGISGDIEITAPDVDISGIITPLNTDTVDLQVIAQNPCAKSQKRNPSTLVALGRGGLPSDDVGIHLQNQLATDCQRIAP